MQNSIIFFECEVSWSNFPTSHVSKKYNVDVDVYFSKQETVTWKKRWWAKAMAATAYREAVEAEEEAAQDAVWRLSMRSKVEELVYYLYNYDCIYL